jgi:hypothetical protein
LFCSVELIRELGVGAAEIVLNSLRMRAVLVVLFVSVTLVTVHGRPNGAPADACDSLTPGHGDSSQENSSFQINMDQFENPFASGEYFYTPGRTYTIRLENPINDNIFRGFFVQCRSTLGDMRVGAFGVINSMDSQLGPCTRQNSSITHTNNDDKAFMMMNWTAPVAGTGPIEFAYAVVQTFSVYWANVRGPQLQEESPIVDECPESCGDNAFCSPNTDYECQCLLGFTGNADINCTAIVDECPESCGDNAYCSPTTGYECQCIFGFTGNADINCTDIDECQYATCGDGSTCINVPGSYYCSCPPGYFYNEQFSSCELESNCTFTDCYRNEHCIVTDDSDEVCICNDGYVFNVNNYECELGDTTLPLRLAPTVIEYSGPCSELDTYYQRDEIYNRIHYILERSVVYSDNFNP